MPLPTVRTEALIDGRWVSGEARFAVSDPATEETLAHVADLGAAETELAIAAAARAFPGWAGLLAKERAAVLKRWFGLVSEHAEPLAQLITAEGGKPLTEARGEVAYGAAFIEWYAEEAKRAYGRTIPTTARQRRYVTIKQPIGVAAAITPWNFPMAMITRKAAPALAAGCTLVLKPPELTPLTALYLAELAQEAGLPPGVLNVVTTTQASAVGRALTDSPFVRKLSFTGSTAVGKTLMAQCAGTMKRLSLELGGNAPFVIFEDADIEAAANAVLQGKFRNSGQVCTTPNRVLVARQIHDAFAAKLAEKVRALKVGPGAQADVQVGPLIERKAVEKVERLVRAAVAAGAQATAGGKPHRAGANFFEPTVLAGVTPTMAVFREEIFGPVIPLVPFDGEDEAVRLANDTNYGLQAYLFAKELGRAWRVAERLEFGMVSVNEGLMSNEVAPFGGMKESGLGREGGLEGLDEFLEVKTISFSGIG